MSPPPPPKSPPENKSSDSWEDALGERAQQTVSPEMVRKLLEMNPALREAGMTTNGAIDQVQQAHLKTANEASANKKPASVGIAATGRSGTPPGGDIVQAFGDFKQKLAAERKRIDDEMEKLKKAKDDSLAQTRERVTQWLLQNDPDMRSPVTQTLLEKEKAFLDLIGFSVKGYVEKRMSGQRR